MTEREVNILCDRLIPRPQKINFRDGAEYILCDNCMVTVNVRHDGEQCAELAGKLFASYWQCVPEVRIGSLPEALNNGESYEVKISENVLEISGNGTAAVFNAMKTLRQLAEVQRGTERVSGYFLVQCEIRDFPALAFRGIHLCIFPETPLWDIEKQLRIAAYHKFNYAVIEPWGVFPFESHPEFVWKDKQLDKAELKRLVSLGKELGITLIPQFNLLGHASASRAVTGKHAVLSYDPKLQPLFEPEGWSWCLTNPETRKIQTDLVLELYEFFDCPEYFHIGCDEADNIATCRDCRRKELKALVKEHICYFHDLFAGRNARLIMWHDMLITKGDPRWKGYTACGLPEHQLGELYKELPRDIIIADWQYRDPDTLPEDADPEWPVAKFFQEADFEVLVCPWLNWQGIAGQVKMAAGRKLAGMLETTWHIFHDSNAVAVYCCAAGAAWNPENIPSNTLSNRLALAQHTRQIDWDMKVDEYIKTGWCQYQLTPGVHPRQEF